VLTCHDESVPLARRKLAQLDDGGSTDRPERNRSVDLEATWTTLCIPQDDVRVLDVLESDTASLLQTGTRRVEEVDDRATAAMHVEGLLPEDRKLLDGERARNRPMERTDPGDVQRPPQVHPEVPNEPSASVPPGRL
jgi:hypothetical protein